MSFCFRLQAETGPLRPGDIVEIHGLQSVSGQAHCSRNKLFRFSSVSFSPEALNGKHSPKLARGALIHLNPKSFLCQTYYSD